MMTDKRSAAREPWPAAAGFTLLEVRIAIAIMAAILVILFGTYSAAGDFAARTAQLSQVYHGARVLLRLMANDPRSACVKEPVDQAQQASPQANKGPSVFVGEDRPEANHPIDKLEFFSDLPTRRPDVPDTELCHVTYSVEPVSELPESRALFRRLNCSLDPEGSDQDQLYLLTGLNHGLDLKYCDEHGNEYPDWTPANPVTANAYRRG
jgi:type II secretory pathway pseudopilin PulG